jgi:ankyrin repeat protein
MTACHQGHIEVVNILLSSGAKVDYVDRLRESALTWSCRRPGNEKIVSILLQARVQPNITDAFESPLVAALRSKSFASAELLLAAGADIEFKSAGAEPDGDVTPLGTAIDDHNIDAARFIIDAKADINNRSGSGEFSPISKAILKDNMDMVKLILSYGPDLSVVDLKGWNCLHTAAVGQRDELMAVKQDNAKDMFAENRASRDYPSLIRMLVEAKADLEVKNSDTMTPLVASATFSNLPALKTFIALGVDLNATSETNWGSTALTFATREGNVDAVRALVEARADVNAACTGTKDGYTPIMVPIPPEVRKEIVNVLYRAGADVNHMVEGRTVLDIAYSHLPHPGCICVGRPKLYEKLGALSWEGVMIADSALVEAAYDEDVCAVAALLPRASVEEKERALVLAARYDDMDMVKLLLGAGTDPSCRQGGTTPLLIAAREDHAKIVSELLKAGADMGATVMDETAMKRAMKNKNRDIVQLLYDKTKELKKANKQ